MQQRIIAGLERIVFDHRRWVLGVLILFACASLKSKAAEQHDSDTAEEPAKSATA